MVGAGRERERVVAVSSVEAFYNSWCGERKIVVLVRTEIGLRNLASFFV